MEEKGLKKLLTACRSSISSISLSLDPDELSHACVTDGLCFFIPKRSFSVRPSWGSVAGNLCLFIGQAVLISSSSKKALALPQSRRRMSLMRLYIIGFLPHSAASLSCMREKKERWTELTQASTRLEISDCRSLRQQAPCLSHSTGRILAHCARSATRSDRPSVAIASRAPVQLMGMTLEGGTAARLHHRSFRPPFPPSFLVFPRTPARRASSPLPSNARRRSIRTLSLSAQRGRKKQRRRKTAPL